MKTETHDVAPVEPAAHGLDAPPAAVHEAPLRAAVEASGPVTFQGAHAHGDPLTPDAVVCSVPSLEPTAAHVVDADLAASARGVELALPAATGPAPALVEAQPRVRGTHSTVQTGSKAVLPLAGGSVRRSRLRPGGPALTQRRRRVPWETLSRERLLAAWARILREHGLDARETRLVGVFGPLPLGAVVGAALDLDGDRAVISLKRTRVAGPVGDLALARHAPTGRLVSVVLPSAGGASGGPR